MKKRHQSKEVQALEARISTLENTVQHMDNYLRQLDAHMHTAASSPQVDQGSVLAVNLDTTEKGELDALAQHEDSIRQDYQRRVDAWHLREQGAQDYLKRVDAWNLREQAVQAHHEGGR